MANLSEIKQSITVRLNELKPLVDEYEELVRVDQALATAVPERPASKPKPKPKAKAKAKAKPKPQAKRKPRAKRAPKADAE